MAKLNSFVLVFLLISISAGAAERLRFVTGDDYPPFVDQRHSEQGLSPALVRMVAKEMGVEIEIHALPWKRGYQSTLLNEFSATFPYVDSDQRRAEMVYSEPLYDTRNVLFVRALSVIQGPAEIKGKTACFPLGYAVEPRLRALLDSGQLDIVRPANMEACISLVNNGRADMVMVNEVLGHLLISDLGIEPDRFRVVNEWVQPLSHYLIAPRNHPDSGALIADFNRSLLRLKATSAYRQLIDRFLFLPPAP